jgi:putative transposase
LTVWFAAAWQMTSQKHGISAHGLKRVLGIGSEQTAWAMLHRYRTAMVRPGRDRLSTIVEVDETVIGGPQPGRRGRGALGKTMVAIAVEQDGHLAEIYGVKVGRDLISRVTDAVMEDVRAWALRPLEDVYPIVFLDCLVLKIREGGSVQRRACYLALGVTLDGDRDVLGMWFQETEGAKFWMQVLTDLKQRGVQDILICCVDGLKGFPEAIEAIFPKTTVQTCIVHLIRASLKYVPRREREQVARDLKPIYTAIDADGAQQELERFDEKWGARFPVITQAWLDAWEHVTPFLAFPSEVRRVIYTTNAIEALNRQLRKAIKTKGHFPNEDAGAS